VAISPGLTVCSPQERSIPPGRSLPVGPNDVPAIWLNRETMERYRPEMRKYYFDATRYQTYLEQLGVAYPAVRKEP